MKNKFIPISNNIDKAIAFAPSLDQKFIKNNSIEQTPTYIQTVDVIENLQNQGWKINGVCEQRGHNRKISSHYIKLEHPDFTMYHNNGKTEGLANIYITNSCNGKSPLNLDFGMRRLVCSNGLIRRDSYMERSFKHNEQSLRRIPIALQDINKHAQRILTEFNKLKHKELTPQEMMTLASKAAKLRFDDDTIHATQLLQSYRSEDEGNTLWNVYNRIQENLIKSNLLVDKDGRLISGVSNVKEDMLINTKLVELVEEFI
jgi:hypothetical protein